MTMALASIVRGIQRAGTDLLGALRGRGEVLQPLPSAEQMAVAATRLLNDEDAILYVDSPARRTHEASESMLRA